MSYALEILALCALIPLATLFAVLILRSEHRAIGQARAQSYPQAGASNGKN